jgi:sterol desaturase/sphingolipid hydroxylase (fatty acid hydroxylase superfamily)
MFVTWMVRAVIILCGILCYSSGDHMVSSIWNQGFVKHDSFEPIIAALSFRVFSYMYSVLYPRLPTEREWVLAISGFVYLSILLSFDMIYPRNRYLLYPSAPTAQQMLLECLASIVLYDFLFFWVHVLMHRITCLRRLHARHHTHGADITVDDTTRLGFLDASAQVLTNVFVLNVLQLHPMSRRLHNILIVYMLFESHSGLDLPWMLHRVIPFSLYGGAPNHRMHHKYGDRHFHQFFKYLDWIFDPKPKHTPHQNPIA